MSELTDSSNTFSGIAVEDVRDEINVICDQFYLDNDILVSDNTRNLFSEMLKAILTDPHPNWNLPLSRAEKLNNTVKQFLTDLPTYLDQIATSEQVGTEITFYHALHWIVSNLDSYCPFDK